MKPIANRPSAIAKNKGIEQIEAAMLGYEQMDCPVVHKFGEGIYIREVVMPRGIIAIGHRHRVPCYNQMLQGKVAMVENGAVSVIEGKVAFAGKAGERKVGYVIDTVVWQNIWANPDNCRDIEKLEARYLDKSETWRDYEHECSIIRNGMRERDRDDYLCLLKQYGFDEATVRAQSENESDQVPMPDEWLSFTAIHDSEIQGRGMFSTWPFDEGDVIAPARLKGCRTPAGRYVNHSANPNCVFVKNDAGDIYLVAKSRIRGCKGGEKGDELTVDYRQALALSGIYPKEEEGCQE